MGCAQTKSSTKHKLQTTVKNNVQQENVKAPKPNLENKPIQIESIKEGIVVCEVPNENAEKSHIVKNIIQENNSTNPQIETKLIQEVSPIEKHLKEDEKAQSINSSKGQRLTKEEDCNENDFEEGVGQSISKKVLNDFSSIRIKPHFIVEVQKEEEEVILEKKDENAKFETKNKEQIKQGMTNPKKEEEIQQKPKIQQQEKTQLQPKQAFNSLKQVEESEEKAYYQHKENIKQVQQQPKIKESFVIPVDQEKAIATYIEANNLKAALILNTDLLEEAAKNQTFNESASLEGLFQRQIHILSEMNEFSRALSLFNLHPSPLPTELVKIKADLSLRSGLYQNSLVLYSEVFKREEAQSVEEDTILGIFSCLIEINQPSKIGEILNQIFTKQIISRLKTDAIVSLACIFAQIEKYDAAKDLFKLVKEKDYALHQGIGLVNLLQDNKGNAKNSFQQLEKEYLKQNMPRDNVNYILNQNILRELQA